MSLYKNNHLLARLDKMAQWTHIPDLASGNIRRRRLRFLPAAILFIGSASLALILLMPQFYWLGYAALMLGFGVSNFLPMFGPVKQAGNPDEEADERERSLRRDAYLVAFASIGVAAFMGIWAVLGLTMVHDWPKEILMRAMMALSFYLMLLFSAVPTLYASWVLPAPLDDADE
ncbi:hypothetical protein ACO0LF_18325 [Undibacterium sp. Di27W]|uniref:hypothetical protein n=1 Tax=Undibacterium sp. Di27W TaxID=3413036 RepID=UPI003BF3A844